MNPASARFLRLFLDRGCPVDDDRQRRRDGLLGRRADQESLATSSSASPTSPP